MYANDDEMGFEVFLRRKHLEDCTRLGRILTESEWVSQVLNNGLPKSQGLAYVSVNQWMHGDRNPDGKNIIKLIRIFGPEIMPYLGIDLPHDLAVVLGRWNKMSPEKRKEIVQIVDGSEKEEEMEV